MTQIIAPLQLGTISKTIILNAVLTNEQHVELVQNQVMCVLTLQTTSPNHYATKWPPISITKTKTVITRHVKSHHQEHFVLPQLGNN